MGARILVQSGIAAGTTHWIQRSVVRIGSDPGMDITVPQAELAKHAMTLEYRDGQYHVHNRSSELIHVGGRTISPGAAIVWPDTDLLQCNGSIQLALELDQDPSPGPPTTNSDDLFATTESVTDSPSSDHDTFSGDATGAAESTDSNTNDGKSLSTQIAIIAICVLLCGFLLFRDRMRKRADVLVDVPRFDDVVRVGLQRSDEADAILLRQMQYAESALIRGNPDQSRRHYSIVRSKLLRRSEKTSGGSSDWESDMLRLAEDRLSR